MKFGFPNLPERETDALLIWTSRLVVGPMVSEFKEVLLYIPNAPHPTQTGICYHTQYDECLHLNNTRRVKVTKSPLTLG